MDDHLANQLATAMSGTTGRTTGRTTGPVRERAYRADATTSATTFTVKEKLGLFTATGAIPLVGADVTVDADGLPRGTAQLDVSAIDTGNAHRDRDLRGRRFFDAETFPLLDFRSVSTRRTDDGVVVDGLLTVRGEECPLTLTATLSPRADGSIGVHATGRFDRMTSPLRRVPRAVISRTVDIVVDAVLRPAPTGPVVGPLRSGRRQR